MLEQFKQIVTAMVSIPEDEWEYFVQHLSERTFEKFDPKKVAVILENMIRRQQKQMTLPYWMMLALKLRYAQQFDAAHLF